MRLDLFLKASRLILRRTLVQEFCDAGRVRINDVKAKSSRDIKVGEVVEIRRNNRILKVRVLEVPNSKQVAKQNAANLYEVISEEILNVNLWSSSLLLLKRNLRAFHLYFTFNDFQTIYFISF